MAGESRHFASVEYAVPNVRVAIVELAAGDDPVAILKYPERSFEFAFNDSVGDVPAPVPAVTVGAEDVRPLKCFPEMIVPLMILAVSESAAVTSMVNGKPHPPSCVNAQDSLLSVE